MSKFAKKVAELWPYLKIILAELTVIFKKVGRILFQTVGNTVNFGFVRFANCNTKKFINVLQKIVSKFGKKVAEFWPYLKIILAELAMIFKKIGRILFQTVGNTEWWSRWSSFFMMEIWFFFRANSIAFLCTIPSANLDWISSVLYMFWHNHLWVAKLISFGPQEIGNFCLHM